MKIIAEYHYSVRDSTSVWSHLCYQCLCVKSRGQLIEIISYSQFPCDACGKEYKAPPGMRLSYKMRTVTYQIVASYPEWDQTAG